MKLVVAILITLVLTDPGKISQINSLKSQAKKAFQSGDYKTAIEKYRYLTDSLAVTEDEVRLNLANALFQQNDTTEALNLYQQLNSSTDIKIRSRASQQMGVMNNRQGKFEEALSNFKQAIKSDPANQDARFNYEMLKKKIADKKRKEEEERNKRNQKPSEFAKKLKEQADQLVNKFMFNDAFKLMQTGLQKDQTVSYYEDFINRLKTVTAINSKVK
jgi:tetratricopeptide (TPR) repeat protein